MKTTKKNDNMFKQACSKGVSLMMPGTHHTIATVTVSPCSWMYPNYGLQVQAVLPNGTNAFAHDKGLAFKDATYDDILRLVLNTFTTATCSVCGDVTLEGNRSTGYYKKPEGVGEICERCYLNPIKKEYDDEMKKQDAKDKRKNASMKKKGYKYRVNAWVHPVAGGDDYSIFFFTAKKPTKTAVKRVMPPSLSYDDFTVVAL